MRRILILLSSLVLLTACLDDDSGVENDDFLGNFEACWTAMDEHYCFFDEKNVDWDKVYKFYLPYFRDSITNIQQEFTVLGHMLSQVRDGHVNLYSPFNTARYWKWYEDYPHNFNKDLVQEYYLKTNYWAASGFRFTALKDSVAYVRYESFTNTPGETNIDYLLMALSYCRGMIFDIRDNGGGALTNVPLIARRFSTEKTCYGYIQHKTGKGHNDFSSPEPMHLEPSEDRLWWDASVQPVVILANRRTYSAANNFVQAMKAIAETKTFDKTGVAHEKMIVVVGDRTGGGGGMPFETVLPNGWVLRFSACPITDNHKRSTESGIDPDFSVNMDSLVMFNEHRDEIIDFAHEYIINNTRMTYEKKE